MCLNKIDRTKKNSYNKISLISFSYAQLEKGGPKVLSFLFACFIGVQLLFDVALVPAAQGESAAC